MRYKITGTAVYKKIKKLNKNRVINSKSDNKNVINCVNLDNNKKKKKFIKRLSNILKRLSKLDRHNLIKFNKMSI